jgi:hypothetical protein
LRKCQGFFKVLILARFQTAKEFGHFFHLKDAMSRLKAIIGAEPWGKYSLSFGDWEPQLLRPIGGVIREINPRKNVIAGAQISQSFPSTNP